MSEIVSEVSVPSDGELFCCIDCDSVVLATSHHVDGDRLRSVTCEACDGEKFHRVVLE